MRIRNGTRLVAAVIAPVLLLTACGGDDETAAPGAEGEQSSEPTQVGIITSTSGPLATYGKTYLEGLEAGLDYATDGTGEVNGSPVEFLIQDDGGDPAKAVSAATDLVGQGVTILAGPASSAVSLQLAPFAAENEILYISGAAAADAITGINKNTFRAGRQTYQDVATAATLIGEADGEVVVFAQDTAFGKGNVTAVETVLGGEGATVSSVLAPATAVEFTPFAQQIKDAKPALVFVAWAGDTTAAMWQSLQQQGVFDATTVTTGLGDVASYASYGADPSEISFLAHYVPDTLDNEVATAMSEAVPQTDLFTPDGFVTAQMIVRALEEGTADDTASMIAALEGWEFEAPKGTQTIRASDHAMLQPMFTATLSGEPGSRTGEVLSTLEADDTAPPEK